jgi:hypothetical protein
MQFAARQRGLQEVGGVHRAVGLAGPDKRVHLVDEQDDAALGGGHLGQQRLQPLLELAAIFGAGDQRAHVERQQALIAQRLRHVAVDDAQRKALDDGGLADAGLTDQNGIVLGAAAQHLHGAADFFVAADDRVELACAGGFGEVAGVFLQRVIAVLGARGVRRTALADVVDGGVERLRGDAGVGENLRRLRALLQSERDQQPLDGDERVPRLLGELLGGVEQPRGGGRQIELAGAAALHFRQFL